MLRTKLLVAASLLLLIVLGPVGYLYGQQRQIAGKVIALRGRVEVQAASLAPAVLNQILYEGDLIRTLARSRAVILLSDETQLKLGSNTELLVRTANRSSDLISRVVAIGAQTDQSIMRLNSGRLYVRSKKRPARVRVNTPAVTAAIRGTEFDLQVYEDGESVTTVLEGVIDFSNEFGAIVVNSGEQGRARVGEAPTKTIILNPEDAVQWTFFYTASVSGRDYPFVFSDRKLATEALAQGTANAIERARLQHDAGEIDAALSTLEGNRSPQAAEVRGWIYLEQNKINEALSQLQLASKDSPRTRLGLALAHLRVNEFEQAYEILEAPSDNSLIQIQKAALALTLGEAEAASDQLERITAGEKEYALGRSLLSTVYLTQNRKEEAVKAATEAVRSAPNSPSAHLSLSLAQQAFFDLDAATSSAKHALDLDPDFLQAQVQYARLLFGAGMTSKAAALMAQAASSSPGDAGVSTLQGFISLARGRSDEAQIHFERALQLDSTQADPHLGLGVILMRHNRYPEAAAEILVASTLEPRLAIYQSYLAKAFYEQRKFEQAFSAIDSAVEMDPRDPTPHLYSGIFKNDLNRPGEAVSSLEESIRLNDNRAVYRSSYLLDEDRATRNVNVALSYTRLGLAEWGNSKAVESGLDDPTNSSAHLFMARTFLNLPGRTQVGGSELLMTRLLAPVNANAFNAFNDYTTLFDSPRMFWTVGGSGGSFDASGGSILSSGGTPRFAYSALFSYDRTDGFRPQNDDARNYTSVNFFKFALTPESDVLLSYSNQQISQGDPGSEFLINDLNDPNRRSFIRTQRVEVGYHQRLRPGSEVVVIVSGREVEQVLNDPDLFERFGIDFALRRSTRDPNVSVQASHLLKVSDFQLRYGFDMFQGRNRTLDVLAFMFPGDDDPTLQEFNFERAERKYRTAFFRSDYLARPNLVFSAGLNYDWSDTGSLLEDSPNSESTSRWNPQAGIYFTPWEDTSLRFAFFRSLQTHSTERVAPTHLFGFPFAQNEFGDSRSTAFNLGWDQRLHRGSFLRTLAFYRDRRTPAPGLMTDIFDGHFYGGRVVFNQFLTERLTLVPEYSISRNLDFASLRHDHDVTLGLFYVHPAGVFVTLKENYFRQTGQLSQLATHVKVFTTEFEVAYEMPRKIGLASLRVSNLFDRRYQYLADPLNLEPRIPRRQVSFGLSFNF